MTRSSGAGMGMGGDLGRGVLGGVRSAAEAGGGRKALRAAAHCAVSYCGAEPEVI